MFKNKFITYKNIKISYSDFGKGRVVILLHGFLENKSMWTEIVSALSIKNRIITIDLLGHGNTECIGYVHTMEDQAQIVFAILRYLKVRKYFIVGHSMGGYVALAFSELYHKNIKGLVLLNSSAKADTDQKKIDRDRSIKSVKKDYVNAVRLSISNLFNPDNRDKFAEEIESVKLQALNTSLQGIIASLEGMKIRVNREILLHNQSFPKLLILGKKDPVLIYKENLAQIEGTNTQLVTFPDGHMSHIENTKKLIEVLKEFVKVN